MDMNKELLIGELIGLARATDGNEHLINPSATTLITEILSMQEVAAPAKEALLNRIREEKRKMVPDCFLCANPCGRTGGYDFKDLQREPADIRRIKMEILKQAENIASVCDPISGDAASYLYRALIVIGIEGYPAKDLAQILSEGYNYIR